MNGAVQGDAAAGEKFFSGKGDCSACPMVQACGGLIGLDLSSVARQGE
jgi:hypothetical protein